MANITEQIKKNLREFSPTTFAVDNATSVIILTLMIFSFGIWSYVDMPKEQFPEASLPTIFVNTPYPGNSAKDIENLVTRPIEKELQSINGVKDIKSTSVQDFSSITVEFGSDTNVEDVLRKVKDAVDKVKGTLPSDLPSDPLIQDVNFADIPILTVNISGNYGMAELRGYAERLEDEIESISEVNEVDLKGAVEREMKVDVDLLKMESMQVSFGDIDNAIRSENMNMSGGEIVSNEFRRAIRVVGEFKDAEELENLIVKSENESPIFLKNIAKVSFGYKERTSIARSGGFPVISLDVIKRKGENLLDASDKIKVVVAKAQEEYLPESVNVSIFNDQSINTRNQVSSLENSIISGVILVVLVLLFFLGIRNAMFVGMAIPLSMMMGIMILYFMGTTMNIVVLFGLILALGLLVDNGIVVVENIYRYMQNGYSGKDAAKFGAGEVAVPIIASTATTLAAFIPLAFWPGLVGEFMKYLPITLIVVLSSSLFVALVINPVFTSKLMKIDEKEEDQVIRNRKRRNVIIGMVVMLILALSGHFTGVQWMRNLFGIALVVTMVNFFFLRSASFYFQNKALPKLERAYNKFIKGALHRYVPVGVFLGTIFLLVFAIWLLGQNAPKVDFFPSADPIYVNVFVDLPLGKDISATDEIMKDLEAKIGEAMKPYGAVVEEVLSQIGENTGDPNSPPEPGTSPHKARLTVSFAPYEKRGGVSTIDIMEKIRETAKGYPGVQIAVDQNADGPPTGKAINLELRGDDADKLAVLSEEVIGFINSKNIPGIEELLADVKIGKPELVININRSAARRYGISTFAIADAIRTSVYGKEVSKYKLGEEEYDIFLRLEERYRYNVGNLLNQKITFRNPANGRISQVPISAVATVEFTSTYSSIKRKNLERVITVYSNVTNDYNANEIVAELQELMTDYEFPLGYSYEFTGEQQQQAEDVSFLLGAFVLAIFSIFLILVAQFNSISSPFIIIMSVVFSTIGVFLGYVFTGSDIAVISAGVGIISLAGIVVNNAIVLIDYINLVIQRKMTEYGFTDLKELSKADVKDAVIEGGGTRLRPVLLTAITTVLGLIPLAIGFNFNFFTLISRWDPQFILGGDNTAFWGPMAWTVIYGLTFATFLTLVVVPVMYWLIYRFKMSLSKSFGKK